MYAFTCITVAIASYIDVCINKIRSYTSSYIAVAIALFSN